ncbi:MAG: hypothetical protein JXA46_10740 [Dehalococcoidales bacterium]|nr:hypothetical protein [Dehalococcoidales bacterium]
MKKLLWIVLTAVIFVLVSGCDYSETNTPAASSAVTSNTKTMISKPPPTFDITLPTEAANIENVVLAADLIVIGEITGIKYEVVEEEIGRLIYTIYTLKIEKTIKGDEKIKEVYFWALGGNNGETAMVYIFHHKFDITDRLMICLQKRPDDTYDVLFNDGSNGQLWLESKVWKMSYDMDTVLGWVILVMKKNNIPIVLPQKDRPLLPGVTTKMPVRLNMDR